MKTILAAALVAGLGAPAYANEVYDFVGNVNYQFDAQVVEATAGVEFDVEGFLLTPSTTFTYDGTNFAFEGVSLLGEYALDQNFTLYGDLDLDNNFKFDEFTVGVNMRF